MPKMSKVNDTIEPRHLSLLNNLDVSELPPVFSLPPLQHGGILRVLDHSVTSSSSIDPTILPHERNSSSNGRVEEAPKSRSVTELKSSLSDSNGPSGHEGLKRPAAPNTQEEYFGFQLPQLPEKQHTRQVVPPIIVGLHEPPNQTAHFPAISSSPFHDVRGRNALNAASESHATVAHQIRPPSVSIADLVVSVELSDNHPVTEPERPLKKGSQQPVQKQARNKWTDEETNQLLLGVKKHGIGKWKSILGDEEFKFNCRNAIQLKDRFRVCFPNGYQDDGQLGCAKAPKISSMLQEPLSVGKTIPHEIGTSTKEVANNTKLKKRSRAHRKDAEDLKDLGILEPFAKSRRRENKRFTEEDDRNILVGFEKHPYPCWALIVKDPALGLQSRQPTDIRDRFRIRYPDRYKERNAKKSRPSTPRPEAQAISEDQSSREKQKVSQGDLPSLLGNDFTPSDFRSANNNSSFKMSFTDLLNETDTFPFPPWDEPAPCDRGSGGMMDIS